MLTNLDKAPFPWFGGKSRAADLVWRLLGDVPHYVEPFCGSCAVLLGRPHPANRPYFSETVNDADGFVVNFWRAVQLDPVGTATAASWPMTEADKTARQLALLRWRDKGGLDRLAGDAMFYDPVIAGWWAWAVSVTIGAFTGCGAWTADPASGRLVRASSRDMGVARGRPQVANGRGVVHDNTREPGVARERPHISDNGMGVNHSGIRAPGVLDPPPADPEMLAQLDRDWGAEYHGLVMPELIRWFRHLAARLRHVRILNGDWSRAVTPGAAWSLSVRKGYGPCGVFLDPPYADTADRSKGLWAHDSYAVAHEVREWCLKWGDHPRFRIVLAGYEGEHGDVLVRAGWTEHEWYVDGFLTGGLGHLGSDGHQQHRERLWASPRCLPVESVEQQAMFTDC